MASLDFTVVENGYSPAEVDQYIEMLQQEYQNAVAWGQELEQKANELKDSMTELGIYFTIDEKNQNEVIEKVFNELKKRVDNTREMARENAKQIIEKAEQRAHAIVRQAMESSVELRTQNDAVMKNLKSISDMIAVILDKAAQ